MFSPTTTSHSLLMASPEWAGHDIENQRVIEQGFIDAKYDADTRDYLLHLYGDGEHWFRQMFYVLGKYLSAPKTSVHEFDPIAGEILGTPIKIADINPSRTYLAQHRLDADPMRNQFFHANANSVELSVSSIVSVIIASQKKISRAIEKITTGRHYTEYVEEVATSAERVITSHERAAAGAAIAKKIHDRFHEKYISSPAEEVTKIITGAPADIVVDLVRELDKIRRPFDRLRDVYRIKCLFDILPQVRKFISVLQGAMPDRILEIRDKFYDTHSRRNYRDAKIILNIGPIDNPVPMEIICQLRTFYDFERASHAGYENVRKPSARDAGNAAIIKLHEDGIHKYNEMICGYVGELFERVGWNVLYNNGKTGVESLLDGFPRLDLTGQPADMLDNIIKKIESNVTNEVLTITDSPRPMGKTEQIQIFTYMARFIVSATIPYMIGVRKIAGDGINVILFNFVMGELYRYYSR